jgi:hypothetical protein
MMPPRGVSPLSPLPSSVKSPAASRIGKADDKRERDQAYREGYVQAYRDAVRLVNDHVPPRFIDATAFARWVVNDLRDWVANGDARHPPVFRPKRRKRKPKRPLAKERRAKNGK